jgi:hypothetical protein
MSIVTELYIKILKRKPTEYENFIYSNAISNGFPLNNLELELLKSKEYLLNKKNIKENKYKKKYKVALCLSGHIRNIQKINHFNFLNVFKNFDLDIYCHTWNTNGLQIPSDKGIGIEYDYRSNIENIEYFKNIYKPKKIIIDNFIDFSDISPKDFYIFGAPISKDGYINATALPKNILSQFYSIKKSFEIIEKKDQYDFFIKSRFDFNFINNINQTDINNITNNSILALSKSNGFSFKNCNMCKNNINHLIHDNMINDFVFVGNKKIMNIYFNTFDNVVFYYNELLKDKPIGMELVSSIQEASENKPCFVPENILRSSLKNIRIIDSSVNGYISR